MTFINKFLCSADGADSPEGGGGAPVSVPAQPAAPAAAPVPTSPGPGNHQIPDYQHERSPRADPAQVEANNVRRILDMGDKAELNETDMRALLGFNPPFKTPPKAAPQAAPAQQETPPQAPAQQEAPAPAQPQVDPAVAAIVEAIRQAQPPQAPQAPQPQPQGPTAPPVFYGGMQPAVEVDPSTVNAILNSENPQDAHKAINVLVNGIMNKVMTDAATLMMRLQQQIMSEVPRMVQAGYAERTNSDSFYSRFPELNKPAFRQIVDQIAGAVIAKRSQQGQVVPGDELYDAIGNAAHEALKDMFGFDIPRANGAPVIQAPIQQARPAPQQQAPAAAPQPRGQFFTPGGARPPAAPGVPQSADWRMNLL